MFPSDSLDFLSEPMPNRTRKFCGRAEMIELEVEWVTQRLFLAGLGGDSENSTSSMHVACDALVHRQCGSRTDVRVAGADARFRTRGAL